MSDKKRNSIGQEIEFYPEGANFASGFQLRMDKKSAQWLLDTTEHTIELLTNYYKLLDSMEKEVGDAILPKLYGIKDRLDAILSKKEINDE